MVHQIKYVKTLVIKIVIVYKTQGYTIVISTCADQSMSRAVDEVKAYITNGGEVQICENCECI